MSEVDSFCAEKTCLSHMYHTRVCDHLYYVIQTYIPFFANNLMVLMIIDKPSKDL